VFGQYTDDTQLTRELILSICENGGFDAESYAGRIMTLGTQGGITGGGKATHQAIQRLAEGVSWDHAGTPPPMAGNGAAMRATPIGMLHWDDGEACVRAARDQAWITHQAPESCLASVVVALATRWALTTSRGDQVGDLFKAITDAGILLEDPLPYERFVEDLEQALFLGQGHPKYNKDVCEYVLAMERGQKGGPWEGTISPWAWTSTLWALFSFLNSPGNFHTTLDTALYPGGDVDTTAAMACALSGAYNGFERMRLDTNLLEMLTDHGKLGWVFLTKAAKLLWWVSTDEGHPLSTPA